MPRRRFLQLSSLALAAAAAGAMPESAVAGPFVPEDFQNPIPADKKLTPAWVNALTAPGKPEVWRGAELETVGMPVGGIACGQLYLGGDGRLWCWDIFNLTRNQGTDGPHYAKPMAVDATVDQGFALRVTPAGGKAQERAMDADGWRDVRFTGAYPIGTVDYADPDCPVAARLEAFSPFVPLDADDSALPATVLRFTLTNRSAATVDVELAGWLENAVCLDSGRRGEVVRRNRIVRAPGLLFLDCRAEADPARAAKSSRPDIPFDDFERETWAPWTATGTAFGKGPVDVDTLPGYMGPVDAHGKRTVNTHHFRDGDDVVGADKHVGTLTSPEFTIERDYVTFLQGGGNHAGRTCVNLIVDGKEVASSVGRSSNVMAPVSIDVKAWAGKRARLVIVDNERGGWGQVSVDDIVFSDTPRAAAGLTERADFGSLGLALLEPGVGDSAAAALPGSRIPGGLFSGGPAEGPAVKPIGRKLVGALRRRLTLAPGAAQTVTFVLAWHFPNHRIAGLMRHGGRHYVRRFADARAVAGYVAQNAPRLVRDTFLWRDTWYDSSLPRWFLDRSFASASTLATSTCHWFQDGRFYGWEGVGCCEGTCTHVWHYAQSVGRLFPALERDLRERTDYDLAFDSKTGLIQHRGTHGAGLAVDGQAGVILRTLREHQMSANDRFLKRVWPKTKRALEFLMGLDADADGILDGPQHNTYDAAWFGKIAWTSILLLAALRAGETMAQEMGDAEFARACRERFETGRANIDAQLYNGQYYIQLPDPANRSAVGSFDGCLVDQALGQAWAHQLDLGYLLDPKHVQSALASIWRYNFTPDIGAWRRARPAGRWYALPGEAGVVMVNWPDAGSPEFKDHPSAWTAMYFNESWTGFEYQVAGHMIAEGMVTPGLTLMRAVHDRYHPSRRNPYNEVECSDHYARAMASYGPYVTLSGYRYHGPKRFLSFAPKVGPILFRAAFTAAEGWGTYAQRYDAVGQRHSVQLKWGRLTLKTLSVPQGGDFTAKNLLATIGRRNVAASFARQGDQLEITFKEPLYLRAGEMLYVSFT